MPELPEVEVIARALRPLLLGRTIRCVSTSKPSCYFLTPPARLRTGLPNERIDALTRKGKYLVLSLSSGCRLLVHLGMTGQLRLDEPERPHREARQQHGPLGSRLRPAAGHREPRVYVDRHTHLTLEFVDGGPPLRFRDPRKFGRVHLLDAAESSPRLDKLGPDALAITGKTLFAATRNRRLRIKSLLLDQAVTAGIGNIYADESLFLAGIHPERVSGSLGLTECGTLARVVRKLLRLSIRAGGSSIDDYVHPDGTTGGFQRQFRVYGRAGEPCLRCETPIERLVIGQRASHFCPSCQKLGSRAPTSKQTAADRRVLQTRRRGPRND